MLEVKRLLNPSFRDVVAIRNWADTDLPPPALTGLFPPSIIAGIPSQQLDGYKSGRDPGILNIVLARMRRSACLILLIRENHTAT